VDADAVEIRVLGCLIEKQRTTPDVYPLSLNSLRLACNQSTNRDPVVAYEEAEIRAALGRLDQKRWARLASGPGSRAAKYRHLLDETLGLEGAELSLLALLMLRGPQTPGELKQRGERMHAFESTAHVEQQLERLAERDLVVRLERRPGQKEERYLHRLSEEAAGAAPITAAAPEAEPEPLVAAAPRPPAITGRVETLEGEVATLREDLAALRSELGALRDELGA